MPYIKQKMRKLLNPYLAELTRAVGCNTDRSNRDGVLNYCITMLLHTLYKESYAEYNRAIGMLDCVKLEYYRRVIALYEDKKIEENGDI